MINFVDTASVQALVDARREALQAGNRQHETSQGDIAGFTTGRSGLRQFLGLGFIQVGARLSGFANQELCLVQNCDSEVCVPV